MGSKDDHGPQFSRPAQVTLRPGGFSVWGTTWFVAMWLHASAPQVSSLYSYSVSGVIHDFDSGAPLEGASVTISGDGPADSASATTRGDGRFLFKDLPAGRFIVRASKLSFIPSSYGALSPEGPGVPIVLGTARTAENVDISLHRGATIRGRILDGEGQPASDVKVVVSRLVGNGSKPNVVRWATTDNHGDYVASGLPAGMLVVAAVPAVSASPAVRTAPSEIETLLHRARAQPATPADTNGGSEATFYREVPTYYPGTFDVAQASPVATTLNREQDGIDFSLQATELPTIEGVVESAGGLDMSSCDIAIQSEDSAGIQDEFAPLLFAPAPSRFRFARVLPGHYLIQARATSRSVQKAGANEIEWASTDVFVNRTGATNVVLALKPAATVAGRVWWPPQADVTPPIGDTHIDLVSLPVRRSLDLERTLTNAETIVATTQLESDASFSFRSVPPGRYQLRLSAAGGQETTWWARSASSGGRNDPNAMIEVGTSAIDDVVLSVSNRHSELAGLVQTPAGRPWNTVVIVVFPADRGLAASNSALIRSARPGSDGSFVFKDLPAGPYIVAALEEIAPDVTSEYLFDELARTGIRVSVRDGERTTLDIRPIRTPRPISKPM